MDRSRGALRPLGTERELSSPLPWPESLTIAARLGEGATAEIFEVTDEAGAHFVLKRARTREHRDAIQRELSARVLGSSLDLDAPFSAGWTVLAAPRVLSSRDAAARPCVLLPMRGGVALSEHPATRGERDARVALAREVAIHVGLALEELHAGGVAHGDVKPANVLVGDDGARLIDFGLAGPSMERVPRGGTPRYLALGDRDLGDARERDRLAFGAVLAEILEPTLRDAPSAIEARAAKLPAPFDEIVTGLVARAPAARARPAWAARRLATNAELALRERSAARARVRNVYLRLVRSAPASEAASEANDAAPWLATLRAWESVLAELGGEPRELAPLSRLDRRRWLVGVVGDAALAWRSAALANASESALAAAMLELAGRVRPEAWTMRDLERALEGQLAPAATTRDERPASAAARVATLAMEVMRVPVSDATLEAIERERDLPASLAIAGARALRLRGEVGRALALAHRASAAHGASELAVAADIARRAGDAAAARAFVEGARERTPLARAVLARLALDEGRPDDALVEAGALDSPATCEIAALAHVARGSAQTGAALAALDAAASLPCDAEERARLLGARGYVLAATQPREARAAFASAAEHATLASARIEEATYRTGTSASGADLGYLSEAVDDAERAVLLWEHLGMPLRAARALLNAASARSVGGQTIAARDLAARARELARLGGDAAAEVYALAVLADVAPTGGEEGAAAARRATELALEQPAEVALRALARAARHGVATSDELTRGDVLAAEPAASTSAKLEWWSARRTGDWIARVVSVLDEESAIGSRGPAIAAALAAAIDRGDTEAAPRLRAALRATAEALLSRAGAELSATIGEVQWVRAARAEGASISQNSLELPREQTRQLARVVRSLAESARLGDLLRTIVDALVMWTGAERGLLLVRAPDGRLLPRAGRNLAHRDLSAEQRGVSTSLARRALERGEPVVAVDAASELGDMGASAHALRLRSVLAVPLIAGGDALGVAYLDDRVRRGAFGEREVEWASTLGAIAASLIARALAEARLRRAVRRAERRAAHATRDVLEIGRGANEGDPFGKIIGESDAMKRTIRVARRMAASDVPILLRGESGSGKELFARAIHEASARSAGAFVSENCSAIPEPLLESALFGHVRGAFTGADRARVGLFEAADKGTLFLDEIGEMSLAMQAKLLRILEDGLVRPLGTSRVHKVDVRLVAATHRDLAAMVRDGRFREDLLYRLDVLSLAIPPLRERREDVAILVAHFVRVHAAGRDVRVSRAAIEALEAEPWPGNVRHLENELRRALVLADDVIDVGDLSFGPRGASERRGAQRGEVDEDLDVKRRVDALETSLVRRALAETAGNQTQAARKLGLSRFGLQKMMKRLGIEPR
ncbi:MAG: sigma 54-interacting transcriptional regulator [Polyangiaceae bacterium]